MTLSKDLKSMLDTALSNASFNKPNDPSRISSLRFSGLPFCAVRFSISARKSLSKFTSTDFSFNYYTRVGTIVHTLVQSALDQNLLKGYTLIGDWICSSCKNKFVLAKKPLVCTCGCVDLVFEEHEIRRKSKSGGSDILGHVDTILQNDLTRNLVVVDWKTTSMKNLESAVKTPNLEYKTQIRAYAGAIGPRVTQIALGFIPRDSPLNFKFYTEDFSDHTKYNGLLEHWSLQHAQALSGKTKEIVLSRPCRTRTPTAFKNCKFRLSCAEKPDHEVLDFLHANSAF